MAVLDGTRSVGFWYFTVRVLSFGIGMRNSVDLLMLKVVALFFRIWLSGEEPIY